MPDRLRREFRLARVLAASRFAGEFGSLRIGRAWGLIRPLATFAILWVIFGRALKVGGSVSDYPLFLLLGIVVWGFFSEATRDGMVSIVEQRSLIRQVAVPIRAIPLAALFTAVITLGLNSVALAVFVVWRGIVPSLDWFLLVPLLAELFLFTYGVALLLGAFFVRFRDLGQVWALVLQAAFYLTPIIYPLGRLPLWAQKLELVFPVTQVLEDIRHIVLANSREGVVTATDAFGSFGTFVPLSVALVTFIVGIGVFRREAPRLPEEA